MAKTSFTVDGTTFRRGQALGEDTMRKIFASQNCGPLLRACITTIVRVSQLTPPYGLPVGGAPPPALAAQRQRQLHTIQ